MLERRGGKDPICEDQTRRCSRVLEREGNVLGERTEINQGECEQAGNASEQKKIKNNTCKQEARHAGSRRL